MKQTSWYYFGIFPQSTEIYRIFAVTKRAMVLQLLPIAVTLIGSMQVVSEKA